MVATGPVSHALFAFYIGSALQHCSVVCNHDSSSCLLQGLFLIVLWPAIVCFTAAGTFFTIKYQQQINQQLGTGFGYTILLSFINIVSSEAVSFTTEWEEWHPSLRTNVGL